MAGPAVSDFAGDSHLYDSLAGGQQQPPAIFRPDMPAPLCHFASVQDNLDLLFDMAGGLEVAC